MVVETRVSTILGYRGQRYELPGAQHSGREQEENMIKECDSEIE
jgi:hypothetical protein